LTGIKEDDATREVFTATELAMRLAREHDLRMPSLRVVPGAATARRWNPQDEDYTAPVLPAVEVHLGLDGQAYLAWCRALRVGEVSVKRRAVDTPISAVVDREGITWHLGGAIVKTRGPRLPGIAVQWARTGAGRAGDQARITVDQLATTLAASGAIR
jgi:hypothetical protein